MRFKDREELFNYLEEVLKIRKEKLEAELIEEYEYELAKYEMKLLKEGLDEGQISQILEGKKRELIKEISDKVRPELEVEVHSIKEQAVLDDY
ncbi:MAG: hypothetical protein ACUVTL_06275 [Thermoproteota archaeon]